MCQQFARHALAPTCWPSRSPFLAQPRASDQSAVPARAPPAMYASYESGRDGPWCVHDVATSGLPAALAASNSAISQIQAARHHLGALPPGVGQGHPNASPEGAPRWEPLPPHPRREPRVMARPLRRVRTSERHPHDQRASPTAVEEILPHPHGGGRRARLRHRRERNPRPRLGRAALG